MSSGDHNDQLPDEDSDRAGGDYSGGESDDEHAAAERSGQHDEDECTLFVKNIDPEATEEQLRELFPESTKIRIPLREDGAAKGFAYLVFDSSKDVEACIEEKQGVELAGVKLYLDYEGKNSKSKPSKRRYGRSSKSLYVSKLADTVTSEMLQEVFSDAKSARVIVNKDTDESRGYGFVEFASHKEAEEALNEHKGVSIEGQEVLIDFAAGPRGGYRGYGRGGWGRGSYGDGGWDRGYGYGFRGYGRGYYRGGRGGFRGRGYGRSRGYYYYYHGR